MPDPSQLPQIAAAVLVPSGECEPQEQQRQRPHQVTDPYTANAAEPACLMRRPVRHAP
jgi:hypothetical protein